jgi:hypothetical protein
LRMRTRHYGVGSSTQTPRSPSPPAQTKVSVFCSLPDNELTRTGMLSAFMGFIEEGDEVIIFEPFFDQ